MALDTGRAERDARIDVAVADVYQAQDDKATAVEAIADADQRIGQAIRRLISEGITTAQAAQLCELTVTAVQRLKSDATDPPSSSVGTKAGPKTRVADAAQGGAASPAMAGD